MTGPAVPPTGILSQELVSAVIGQYPQRLWGIHGAAHWARVLENGRRLAALTGAEARVVELFAIFHDSRRTNEGTDFLHGRQGAGLAKQWRGKYYDLPDEFFDLLIRACNGHTLGGTRADLTVQVCWDSDRLDLGRVGITPDPRRLCIPAARDPLLIAWADERARAYTIPALLSTEWGLAPPDRA